MSEHYIKLKATQADYIERMIRKLNLTDEDHLKWWRSTLSLVFGFERYDQHE